MKNTLKLAILIFFSGCLYSCLWNDLPDPHSLKYKQSFNSLANEIVEQKDIFEVDDFTRDIKSLNRVLIYLGDAPRPLDTLMCQGIPDRCPRSLQRVLDSLHINKNRLADLQEKLKETGLRQFYKSNDSVLFIVDGFLSDSWGFFYSKKPATSYTEEFRFGDYNVSLLDTINDNWRRAAIR